MKRFEDRVAVVTGAAGGIGRATAIRLAGRGCHLALSDIDQEGLESLTEELRSTASRGTVSRRITTHVVDVASREVMEDFAREVEEAHAAAHILVNNAGVVIVGRFDEQKIEDLEWMVGINYWGVVYGCHAFLPLLKRQEEAHIVNLSSMFGFLGLPSQSGYCATKAAVRALSESLYAELRSDRVGVTSIHPGCIDTGIIRAGRLQDEASRTEIQSLFDRRGASPDVVARAIVRAIEKNKLRARVRPESVLTEWAKRVFPVGLHRVISRRYAIKDPTRPAALPRKASRSSAH